MLTPTHLVCGATSYLIIGDADVLGLAAVTSLAADVDTRQSLAGRVLPFLSSPIAFRFGHRTLMHSVL